MNFQGRTQGVGVPVRPPAILAAAAFSSLPLGAGVTVSVCGSPWLDIGLLFPS